MDGYAWSPQSQRRVVIWLFVLVFGSYSYFVNGIGNPNSTTRLALTLALIEKGELNIDDLAAQTMDKAQAGNHYYLDKAPGMSFLAIPVVYVVLPAVKLLGRPTMWFEGHSPTIQFALLQYLVEIFTAALPTSLAVIALYLSALRIGASPGGALFAALGFGLGTPAWGWATTFLSHATSAAVQFLALAVIIHLDAGDDKGRVAPRRAIPMALAVGALLGWSVVTEFAAAPSAAMIALYGMVRLGRSLPPRQTVQLIFTAVAAGLTAVAPLLVYDTLAFGSPFSLGYSHVVGFEGMQDGFHGIHLPNWRVAFAILFGQHRGLLWICPILLLTPWALYRLFQRKDQWQLAALIMGIAAYYVLLNSGYYYWDGGWSTGPRHVTPILPFLCLPLSLLWPGAPRTTHLVLAGLLGLSIGLSLICASVGMFAGPAPRLLLDYLLPMFMRGNWGGILLFQLHLLPPPLTLLPLFLMWAALALLWRGWLQRPVHDGLDHHVRVRR